MVTPSTTSKASATTTTSFTPDDVIAELKLLAQRMLDLSQQESAKFHQGLDEVAGVTSSSSPHQNHSHPVYGIPKTTDSAAFPYARGGVHPPPAATAKPGGDPRVVDTPSSEPFGQRLSAAASLPFSTGTNDKETGGSDVFMFDDDDEVDDEDDDGLQLTLNCVKASNRNDFERVGTTLWMAEKVCWAGGVTAGSWEESGDEGGTTPRSSRRPPTDLGDVTKAFRVPLFPFGGGVSSRQLRDMMKQHDRCIASPAAHSQSLHVKKAVFDSGEYPEVGPEQHYGTAPFVASSRYDYVVEVEREVVFNPAKARLQRQKELKRLMQEKKTPVTMMGTFNLKVIMDPVRTGFEMERTFPITRGSIIADRYEIIQLIAKSTFSRTVRCYDLTKPIMEEEDNGEGCTEPLGYQEVCIKIIHNSKDFFDQSLDEIRLLRLLNDNRDADEAHVIRLLDAFYYKEHCMLVTELLSDSLYEYSRYIREDEPMDYFTVPRLQRIARQVLEALAYVHSLNLIHADLKPENILFVSHRQCTVKVIDFGSSNFLSDHLSSYIQSRNYRAPEVILGCDYDGRIDVWSLGAILMELVLGEVLFSSTTVPEMLARMVIECGRPFPRRLLWEGRYTSNFFTKFGAIYETVGGSDQEKGGRAHQNGNNNLDEEDSILTDNMQHNREDDEEAFYIYSPNPPNLRSDELLSPSEKSQKEFIFAHSDGSFVSLRRKLASAGMTDPGLASFVEQCLTLDHHKRPTSKELLQHPFVQNVRV